jgi:hypothetical protein
VQRGALAAFVLDHGPFSQDAGDRPALADLLQREVADRAAVLHVVEQRVHRLVHAALRDQRRAQVAVRVHPVHQRGARDLAEACALDDRHARGPLAVSVVGDQQLRAAVGQIACRRVEERGLVERVRLGRGVGEPPPPLYVGRRQAVEGTQLHLHSQAP